MEVFQCTLNTRTTAIFSFRNCQRRDYMLSPFNGGAARVFTITDPAFVITHFGASPLDAVCSSLFFGNSMIFHGERRIVWTGGVSIFIVTDFLQRTFISGIVRNQSFRKMKVIYQENIQFRRIKSRITKESIRV